MLECLLSWLSKEELGDEDMGCAVKQRGVRRQSVKVQRQLWHAEGRHRGASMSVGKSDRKGQVTTECMRTYFKQTRLQDTGYYKGNVFDILVHSDTTPQHSA